MLDLRNEYGVEMPRAQGAYLEDAPKSIWSAPHLWVLEPKADGERQSLQIGLTSSVLAGRNRTGHRKGVAQAGAFPRKPHAIFDHLACPELDGTLLDGELTLHLNSDGSPSKDTLKRMGGEFVGFQVWGCLFHKWQDVRHLTEARRYELAAQAVVRLREACPEVALFLRLMERRPASRAYLQELFDRGLEGGVAKYLPGRIDPRTRTMRHWHKLKGDAHRTVDAFVIDVSEASSGGSAVSGRRAKPNGRAASFTMAMMHEGRAVPVCKLPRLPEEVASCGLRNFPQFKERVIEMQVSGFNGGELRWPRFVRWREDKSPSDCVFREQIGREALQCSA